MGRRKSSSIGMNLDSLLDTLTNVVGFLVIVMVLMNLGAREAVDRIRAINPEVFGIRQEDVDRNQSQLLQRQALLEELRRQINALTLEIKKLQEIQKPTKPTATPKMSATEARRLIDQRQKQIQQLEQKFAATIEEIARLKALLERTPIPIAGPSTEISVPDPKLAPTNAVPIWFLCHRNRVTLMDLDGLQQTAGRTINTMKGVLQHRGTPSKSLPKPKKGETIIEFDGPKVEDYFKRTPVGNQLFRLSVRTAPDRTSATLVMAPYPNAGETIDDINKPNSIFQTLLRRAAMGNHYARFIVSPDSFPVYLRARTIIDGYKIPAGWEIVSTPEYSATLANVRIYQRVIPKPVPPPPPGTPQPKRPPAFVID